MKKPGWGSIVPSHLITRNAVSALVFSLFLDTQLHAACLIILTHALNILGKNFWVLPRFLGYNTNFSDKLEAYSFAEKNHGSTNPTLHLPQKSTIRESNASNPYNSANVHFLSLIKTQNQEKRRRNVSALVDDFQN